MLDDGWTPEDVYTISSYYANMPMQYTATFHGCKNVHFQMKFFNIFS